MGSIAGIIVAILFIVVPITIITIIVVAIVRKKKDGEPQESFEQIVRMIYVYILLIGFLFMTVGSVIYAFNSAVNYYIPESVISNASDLKPEIYQEPSDYTKEIQKLQDENNLRNEKNRSLTDLATAISMAAISVPMFIYHSKLARKLKAV